MKATESNLQAFLTVSDRTFRIPVFQRNYEWKDSNCKKLFSDIESVAFRRRANSAAKHFIGTIAYVFSDGNPTFTVIDGQQRLTSVMLLLKAIADTCDDDSLKNKLLISSYKMNTQRERTNCD